MNYLFKDYKYLYLLMMLFMSIFVVCEITAFRMTNFFGVYVPTSGLIIPFVFAMGDLIAEVYGYRISRKMIWNMLVCQFIFGVVMTIIVHLPSEYNLRNNAYQLVFENIIRTNITSCFSVTCGMFVNAFLISKLKIKMQKKKVFFRIFISNVFSELVLCCVAYVMLFTGIYEISKIMSIIVAVWIYKLFFALLISPFVSMLATWLKKKEKTDAYDIGIQYNPFIYHA